MTFFLIRTSFPLCQDGRRSHKASLPAIALPLLCLVGFLLSYNTVLEDWRKSQYMYVWQCVIVINLNI